MYFYKKSTLIVLFAIGILVGFSFFPKKALADYSTAGFLTSNNLLPSQGASVINSFTYDVTTLPSDTEIRIEFSEDGSNWYNSAGTYGVWNVLSSGINTIDLSSLRWRTISFYYKLFLSGNGTDTPVLKSVRVNFIDTVATTTNYYTSGSFTSTNLLSGQIVSSINSFSYNATEIPSATSLTAQFSQDNSAWYNSSGALNSSNTLSAGTNTINLSGLNWSGGNFYYKISFTSDGTDTPVLKSASINFSQPTPPTLTGVSASPSAVIGGNQLTITPTGQGSGQNSALYFYCNETGSATAANTLCLQGNQSYTSSQYSSMTCTYNPTGDASRTVYCRAYDGQAYSPQQTTTYIVDSTAPSGGSVSYTNGYFTTASVSVAYTTGTDSGSGLNNSTGEIQRASATLSNGSCGTFSSFSNLHAGYNDSPYSDTTVSGGNCYMYQYVISDNAGNTATYTSSNIAMVDTAPPSGGYISYTNGYFTTTSVPLTVGDGTDLISGINTSSRIIQRESSLLTSGSCGSFSGTFSTITPSGSYPNFTDNTVSSGNCYMYQYLVSDNAGNQETYTSNSVAEIDTSAAIPQVLINSVAATSPPNVSASVTITNEGYIADDFQYEWCVVANASDACAGNDGNIYYASATKNITPGLANSFNTTLSATVPNAGAYYFKLVASYGSNHSQ